jgi:enoyl-CoA hydratase/carnithine racemase
MQQHPPAATGGHLRVEPQSSGAVWLTIDRLAKHNALARPVLAELGTTVRELGEREGVRYLVITGAGERFFAAGGDLRDLAGVRDEPAVQAMMDEAGAALDAMRHCPLPVIAYLNGDAIGGGAELALACDLRLQAAHARIGYVQARLAITSAWGGGPDLFRTVGAARALRMLVRAELVGAEDALAWGLADAVIRDGARGEDLAAFLRPLDACAPQVLRGFKAQAIAARQGVPWAAQRAVEREHFVRTWLHDDHWAAAEKLLSKGT